MQKTTGVIRKVDDLGRIALPQEQRNKLGIWHSTALNIWVEGDRLIMQIAEHHCSLCGNTGELVTFLDKNLCNKCIEAIVKLQEN